ncbi:MAG: phospholipid carrier-dependent glycosyltransferase [Cyanobacteria bacterium P01_D01_bin.36]
MLAIFRCSFRYVALALVAALSFSLRFWQLGRFNELVFDEVYYVQFAQAYLAGESVFDAHPPLGKYAIAFSIWLHEHTPWLHFTSQPVTAEVDLAPVSYRWMNALIGSLVPLVVVGLAHSLTNTIENSRRWTFCLLAGLFVAIDGLFVTESRYGLLNIYVVFFGLLGHWLWRLASAEKRHAVRMTLRGMSGVAFGCAIATKWNGLGYLLALIIWEGWQRRSGFLSLGQSSLRVSLGRASPLRVRQLLKGTLYLGLLPLLTYVVLWWPHLQLNEVSVFSIHRTLFVFHQELDEFQVACSRWFTWPLLIKPIAYAYEESGSQVYTVNNLGNPMLWWLSGASAVLVVIDRLKRYERTDVTTYLLIGYLANWLPWVVVTRCTYNYLFMPAAVFGFMLLAWLMSGWLAMGASVVSRRLGFVMLGAIALAFFFWLPLSLGLPLTPEALQLRWWLPSWI